MWKYYFFQTTVNGKKKYAPNRETQAAAIADRDGIRKLRADGATDEQVPQSIEFQTTSRYGEYPGNRTQLPRNTVTLDVGKSP